ncbi:MAG: putative bifunctional diguanylate cyclase/phosphodiesterase [Micromonosporaceae bacterium]
MSLEDAQRRGKTRVTKEAAGARHVWLLIAGLAVAGFAIFALQGWWSWGGLISQPLRFAAYFAMFFLASAAQLTIDMGRHSYKVTFSEMPLVLALFYADPVTLLAARCLGFFAVFYLYQRQQLQKAAFNAINGGVAATIAISIAHGMQLGAPGFPASWAIVYAAIVPAMASSALMVMAAITLVQGPPTRAEAARTTASTLVTSVLSATLGILVLLVFEVSRWTVLLLIPVVVAVALGYRGYTQFVRQQLRLAELYELTRAVSTARQDGTLADELLTRTRKLMNSEAATLWLPQRGRYPETLLSARADSAGLIDRAFSPRVFRERALAEGHTVAVGPKLGDAEDRVLLREAATKDVIVVPLKSGTATIGCLEVANRLGDLERFRADDVQLLETLAAHAAVAVENSRLVDRLQFDAYHDALTSLPNRRRMVFALEEAVKIRAPGEVVAAMLFDVDGMRDVNDSLGHAAGDKLLAEVARRLTDAAPDGALVARAGGDEFAVLVRIANADAATELARTLRTTLQRPFTLGTLTIDVDTTVGIALHPEHGAEPEMLLQRADVAAYAAKSIPSGICTFNVGLESRSVRRLGLAGDLRRALDNGEIEVYFQPKIAITDRALAGLECLARWEHPAHGSVAPEDFISVAEHTGQLGKLTDVVLREGLSRCREWDADDRPIGIAVNLSPRSLSDPDFPAYVASLLDEYAVPADRLTLEITEDGMVGETEKPLPSLRLLRELGVRLSVDDFGTGYSSLSYLRRLPVHEVKIDRTFVQGMATDPGDLAIVRAVVDLSRHFGFSVVAEGVESELTLSLLEDMGCDVGQGFFFSRPLPYERLEAWFTAQTELATTPAGEVRRLRAVP